MTRFNASYEGIGDMLRAPFMQSEMDRRAHAAEALAVAIAPFDASSADHYKDHFHVEASSRHDRAGASLVNDDPAAFQIEVGTKSTPAHHTLLKALDAARLG